MLRAIVYNMFLMIGVCTDPFRIEADLHSSACENGTHEQSRNPQTLFFLHHYLLERDWNGLKDPNQHLG